MTREWKPGEIAMIRLYVDQDHGLARYTNEGWRCLADDYLHDSRVVTARPVVVLDPKDREQVKRLGRLAFGTPFPADGFAEVEDLQAALREFANPTPPPRPDEPTGLGAVVEDADGVRWVSWRSGLDVHDRPWQRLEMDTDEFRNYADIAAVTKHFEGVTP